MFKLASLTKGLPVFNESRMASQGFGVWITWVDQLTEAIPHTFQDYGGMLMAEESNQALWFFFTSDVFKAMARLQVWAKLNDLPVYIQVFQAKLLVGFQLEKQITVPTDINAQEALKPDEFQVWVHGQVSKTAEALPGISLERATPYSGLAPGPWHHLSADPRLGYESGLGWYFVLRPLGNPLDKNFAEGWRNLYKELEEILERLKLKYLVNDNYLIFELDNYRVLKTWCLEALTLFKDLKEREESPYWPSVMVVIEKGNLSFNEELPSKIHIDWEQMAPDFPHMSYRTAFMIGDRFKIKDVSFSLERSKLSDWCYVHLADFEKEQGGSLPVNMPAALVAGQERPCFYCGLRNHSAHQCPSRELKEPDMGVWDRLVKTGLEGISSSLIEVGRKVEEERLPAIVSQIKEGSSSGEVLKAIYEINCPQQLRFLSKVRRSLGKEFPEALDKLAPEERDQWNDILQTLVDGDLSQAERMIRDYAFKNPGDIAARVLQGFVALEKGDLEKAGVHWKEAEPLSKAPMHVCYLGYLQARLMEVQYKFDTAMTLYRKAEGSCPKWIEPRYRQAVCMVKMGFTEHALSLFDQLIEEDAHVFNRIIIDPELERGGVQILSHLWGPWTKTQTEAQEAQKKLDDFANEVEEWFGKDSDFGKEIKDLAEKYKALARSENYVAYKRICHGQQQLTKRFRKKVDAEIQVLQRKANEFTDSLKRIHDEISWFPFPKLLKDFNRDYNFCASRLNWTISQHFQVAESFRKSRKYFEEVEERIAKLDSHLVTLRIVRDATLFLLILGRSFMWLEILGLGLALALVPVIIYFAEYAGFAKELLIDQRWALQKALIIVLSFGALTIAVVKTAISFEKKKSKFFDKHKGNEKTVKKKRGAKKPGKQAKRRKAADAA